MDFHDQPMFTAHKIGYRVKITKEMLVLEDMMHPNYHGPLTKEETEYREYEEAREDLDLYEEEWE